MRNKIQRVAFNKILSKSDLKSITIKNIKM